VILPQGRFAAIKLGEEDVQVEGLAVMLEAIKAGDGTGILKQDHVRTGTESVDDAINLGNEPQEPDPRHPDRQRQRRRVPTRELGLTERKGACEVIDSLAVS